MDQRGTGRKPRVAVLVHNDVRRDSRVQKTARSMADRGWDVLVLGCATGPEPERWRLGSARVLLLPLAKVPGLKGPHLTRTPRARDPLAFSNPLAPRAHDFRAATRRVELETLRLQRRHDSEASPVRKGTRFVRWAALRLAVPLDRRLHEVRLQRTERVKAARMALESPVDRAVTQAWRVALGPRSWRRLDPLLWRYEMAFRRRLDRFAPDIVHANDWTMMGVATRAKLRAAERGHEIKIVWDVHEYLPELVAWSQHPRWHMAQLAHEREFAAYADAVVTVSDVIADRLKADHRLATRPTVVMNCPTLPRRGDKPGPSVRERCGVGPDVPILLYSGATAPARGVDMLVRALPELPDAVAAIVTARADSEYMRGLVSLAGELGVADRVHVLPYVPVKHIVGYLSSATVGVMPLHRGTGGEIALITKFFEYSQAGLPLVSSDVKALSEEIERTGQGEVFVADDLGSFVAATRKVLSDLEHYRSLYTPEMMRAWTWDAQAERLDELYRRIVGPTKSPGRP